MADYQKMYALLFNAVTDAVTLLESFQPGDARTLLIRAQQKTEEIYLSTVSDEKP